MLSRLPDFARLLLSGEENSFDALRAFEATGRPLGNAEFIAGLERLLGWRLSKRAPGRKPRLHDDRQGALP